MQEPTRRNYWTNIIKKIVIYASSFLIKKLGLADSADLDKAIDSVMETYGKSNKNKYRAVVYYLLTKHFKKESVY